MNICIHKCAWNVCAHDFQSSRINSFDVTNIPLNLQFLCWVISLNNSFFFSLLLLLFDASTFCGLVCKLLLSISNSKFSSFAFGKCNLSKLSEIFDAGIPILFPLSFFLYLDQTTEFYWYNEQKQSIYFKWQMKWFSICLRLSSFLHSAKSAAEQFDQNCKEAPSSLTVLSQYDFSFFLYLFSVCLYKNCNRKHFRSIQLNFKWLSIYCGA